MNLPLLLNIATFIVVLTALNHVNASWSLAKRVLLGMVLGILFGLALHPIYGDDSATLKQSISWFSIVGGGYIQLLQMIVMPLVPVSVLNSVAKLNSTTSLGKISMLTIGTLLLTALTSALVGVFVAYLFGLTVQGLMQGAQETARLTVVQGNYVGKVVDLSVPQLVQPFIPKNPFAKLTGTKPTSIISVVIFAAFLGVAALSLLKDDMVKGEHVLTVIGTTQAWVVKLVRLVICLTPYDVLALMTNVVAVSNVQDIIKLGDFAVASCLGLVIMFNVHAVLLMPSGINPLCFFRKIWPALSFAFTSRSSTATIPLSIETQTRRIGMPESIASFATSFDTAIDQNGCAGLYPVMLAMMVAPTVGINPFDPIWIAILMAVVTFGSVGVAGVGDSVAFAALIILPTMDLPVTPVALLISIGPLIDIGRTALNVNGSTATEAITSQLLGQIDRSVFNAADDVEMAHR